MTYVWMCKATCAEIEHIYILFIKKILLLKTWHKPGVTDDKTSNSLCLFMMLIFWISSSEP